jgi:hypothetical protein
MTSPENNTEECPLSQRVDGKLHSTRFMGDDPYTECVFCGEVRDALTGAVVREGRHVSLGNNSIVHRGNQVFPAFCGNMDIGNISSMVWDGVTCVACLAELPQPEWRVFEKDDETTWPVNGSGEAGSYTEVWVFAKGRCKIWGWRAMDNHFWASPELAVTHWQPIDRPLPPVNETQP